MRKKSLHWIDKLFVYCALEITQSTGDAQKLLAERGVVIEGRRLQSYASRGRHLVEEVRERGLPALLYGPAPFSVAERLNKIALRMEEKLARSDWSEKTDVDLVTKYLTVMEAVAKLEEVRKAEMHNDEEGDKVECGRQFEELFKSLERAEEQSRAKDTIRHITAATGITVSASEQEG